MSRRKGSRMRLKAAKRRAKAASSKKTFKGKKPGGRGFASAA